MTSLATALRAHPADRPLDAAPINPDWIIAGQPFARCTGHGQDGRYGTAVWDCTAGTFRWHYGHEETICILEGEAIVTGPDGAERRLGPGDVAIFPADAWFRWHVPEYVRKFAILDRHVPLRALIAEVALRVKGKLVRSAA